MKGFITSIIMVNLVWLVVPNAFTQSEYEESQLQDADEQDVQEKPEELWVKPKIFTDQEIAEECKKYENSYLSYSGSVYYVENCTWHQIQSDSYIIKILRRGTKIKQVESDTIAKLKSGAPLTDIDGDLKPRTCKELEGRYITFSYTDVFYVEQCKRRLFLDFETYIEHRKPKPLAYHEILALTWKEFSNLKPGKDMPSVLDSDYRKQLSDEPSIDLIPIDEACKGVNGQVVSFMSRLYIIERCQKKEIDPELFLKKLGGKKIKIIELTAEQWLSLPDKVH